jgi:tRNA pseudouridine55 synthase
MLAHRPTASGFGTGNLQKKSELQVKTKEYTGTFFYRTTTPSYDLETEVDQTYPIDHIDEALIHENSEAIWRNRSKPPIFSISR